MEWLTARICELTMPKARQLNEGELPKLEAALYQCLWRAT